MSTPIDDTYKNMIGAKLTNRLGLALEQQEIEADDAVQVIDLILPVFETMTHKEQLIAFFQKLANGWPFFAEIITEETGKLETSDTIESLFTDRNITYVGVSKGQ